MAFIVMDLEWNQATTEKVRVVEGLPFYLEGEVIQVGAVKLDENFGIAGTLKLNIRPRRYTRIHQMVTKLTGITQAQMDMGMDFDEAMELLQEWCGPKPIYITWGDDDIRMMRQNLALHGMEIGWISRWYNLQWIYSGQLGDGNPPMSLTKVAASLGLEIDAPAHDALNDARYTALICGKLDMRRGVEEYNRARAATYAKNVRRIGGVKHLRRGYIDHLEAFADEKLSTFDCPRCGKPLPEEDWAMLKKNSYISVQTCPEDGPFYLRLNFARDGEGRWAVSRHWLPAAEDKIRTYRMRLAADEKAKVTRYWGKKEKKTTKTEG